MELEESLRVRMDFLLFTDLDGKAPNTTTICSFRNILNIQKVAGENSIKYQLSAEKRKS